MRRFARRALLVLGSLFALEIALRVAAHATHRSRGIVYDEDLGWRPRAGLVRVGRDWSASRPARTNAGGWRDAERSIERRAGVARVAVLGDSFTWGLGVDAEDRYTERLESEIPALEALNFGVCSYGTDQELRVLETEAGRYRPDVVLLQAYLGNDLDDLLLEHHSAWPKPWYELEAGRPVLHPPRTTWDVRLRGSCYLGELVFRTFARAVPRDRVAPGPANRDPVALFVALVARMREVAEAGGARFLVLLVEDAPDPRVERVRAGLAAAGIAVLDPGEAFARAGDAAALRIADGHHWSPAGHALVAREVAARLRTSGWLPRR